MNLNNKIMLITYPDSMGRDITELKNILQQYFEGVVGGVHILPFYPSSGDRGFSPTTYQKVDSAFGSYKDIEELSKNYYLMFDYMINHLSRESVYYQDFLRLKEESPYKDLFIRYKDFWPNGKYTEEQIDKIYKRKPSAPYVIAEFADGSREKIWCTFSEEQIDLNLKSNITKKFNEENLTFLAQRGASLIRLDAFAYATKKVNTDCFFVEPDVWDILGECKKVLLPLGADILPEIHEHYSIQLKLAEHGYWVYDFALPMLVLHGLYSGKSNRLRHWLNICPRKQFTTLDTHDGIGVVDVKDLLSDDEIEFTRDTLYKRGANVKRKYSSTEYNNLDIYQINCTFYSALGNNDAAYLLARVIQLFAPGIPQVYYVGLLAGENDIELLEKTKEGRNINRHYYTSEEIDQTVQRPILQKMYKIMRFRNSYPAFDGEVSVAPAVDGTENTLEINWINDPYKATLTANLLTKEFSISYINSENWLEEVL